MCKDGNKWFTKIRLVKSLFLPLLISNKIEYHIFLSLTYILLEIIKVAREGGAGEGERAMLSVALSLYLKVPRIHILAPGGH